jgi:hypothetical protein
MMGVGSRLNGGSLLQCVQAGQLAELTLQLEGEGGRPWHQKRRLTVHCESFYSNIVLDIYITAVYLSLMSRIGWWVN